MVIINLIDFKPFGFGRGHTFEFMSPPVKDAFRDGVLTTYLKLMSYVGVFGFSEDLCDFLIRIP